MIELTQNDLVIRNINPDLLKEELEAAGLPVWTRYSIRGAAGTLYIAFNLDFSYRGAVVEVLNAHDYTALSAAQQAIRAAEERAEAARAELRAVGSGSVKTMSAPEVSYYVGLIIEALGLDL